MPKQSKPPSHDAQVSFRLPLATYNAIKSTAARLGIKPSALMRDLLVGHGQGVLNPPARPGRRKGAKGTLTAAFFQSLRRFAP